MATIEYWIQLENHPWDTSPHNIDRITGLDMKETTGKDPVDVTLKSPGTGITKTRKMYNPLRDSEGKVKDALILRRYKPPAQPNQSDAWTVPDDRKVNPWDLNELDPTDNGTMGTIPGPVIECNVGDSVIVHFRNLDMRTHLVTKQICIDFPFPFGGTNKICFPFPVAEPVEIEKRVHSLHPHGFVFKATSDGAYPLSPPDIDQPVAGGPGLGPDEVALWEDVPGFSGTRKKGDRVPPGGTFIYRWNTIGWPSTSNVWLYHDHSICDMENVELGAIGIIVIHNPADTQQEVDIRAGDPNDPSKLDPAFLPDGSPNGSPINLVCFPFPGIEFPVLPHDLEGLGLRHGDVPGHGHAALPAASQPAPATGKKPPKEDAEGKKPVLERMIKRGDFLFELDEKLEVIRQLCLRRYDTPPSKALYLQLFHTLDGVSGMIINGRTFMGNTPTMVAGRETRMRFGVVGMGSEVHTFHIHGHRWILPGPQGNTPGAIQSSAQVQAVTQFEDTRIFGPANSFAFTIDGKSGSFMRAGGPGPDDSVGEWHMHCHFLNHMMMGMMGSLLIVKGGEFASTLPRGVPCEMPEMDGGEPPPPNGGPTAHQVSIENATNNGFVPKVLNINVGDTVTWKNNDNQTHTASKTGGPGPNFDSGNISAGATSASVTFNTAGTMTYRCNIHTNMTATVQVNP
jgi:plastocyanin/FtsP/CotA-like multicopper oxidase with cupredoxin domain